MPFPKPATHQKRTIKEDGMSYCFNCGRVTFGLKFIDVNGNAVCRKCYGDRDPFGVTIVQEVVDAREAEA